MTDLTATLTERILALPRTLVGDARYVDLDAVLDELAVTDELTTGTPPGHEDRTDCWCEPTVGWPGHPLGLVHRDAARADTAALVDVLAAMEAALPADWELELSVGRNGRRDLYTAIARYCYSLRHYRAHVGPSRSVPFVMAHGSTPGGALSALLAAIRGATDD